MNIAGKPHQICIVLNNNAFKPALKQMTRTKMSVVKSAGISQRQPLHAFGKIGLIRPQKYMIVLCEAPNYVKLIYPPLLYSRHLQFFSTIFLFIATHNSVQ